MGDAAPSGATTMRRWMLAVGVLYLGLGIGLLPWVNDARIGVFGMTLLTPTPGPGISTTAAARSEVG